MKKLFMTLLVVAGMTTLQAAEPQKTTVNVAKEQSSEKVAEIKFDTLTHDFGVFSIKEPSVKCVFNFTNVGTAPLIIEQVIANCGCTVPTYTKDPVKPGESGQIDVTYNARSMGPFSKVINVRSNAKETKVVRLTIKGTVSEE